jgi:hypothetical protein
MQLTDDDDLKEFIEVWREELHETSSVALRPQKPRTRQFRTSPREKAPANGWGIMV